jgi:signal transduction histidine kinase
MKRTLARAKAILNKLSVRLFLSLWLALVLAHYLGWGLMALWPDVAGHGPTPQGGSHEAPAPRHAGPGHHSPRPVAGRMSVLPITDGLPPPGLSQPSRPAPARGMDQPWAVALIDYASRWLIFGLAAWLIARGVVGPLQRLIHAAEQLDERIAHGRSITPLDEAHGPQELRETAKVFNDMAHRLTGQFEERTLLMAAVSHDIRTPLTRLRLRLEQVAEGDLRSAQERDLAEIDHLVSEVLEALQQERSQERPCAMDLWALVQSSVDDLAELGGAVSLAGERQDIQVQAEPQALRRMLDNLMSNALRHGQVAHVSVQRDDQGVAVHIDDAGPGIPTEQLDAVFKPFHRLDAARSRHTGGVGLGLYITRQLAKRQGLVVSLGNRPQGGLRASIRWAVPVPR